MRESSVLSISAVVVVLAATPAFAQGDDAPPRRDSPPDDDGRDPLESGRRSPTGRTTTPPPSATDTGRHDGGQYARPDDDDKPGLLDWPWHGTVRSPEWTQDSRYFPGTRFWALDAGRVELDVTDDIPVTRHDRNHITNFIGVEAQVGIVPHLALGVTENVVVTPGADLLQEGNRIELRLAPFEYGVIPLNPAFMFAWNPRHGDFKDQLEVRVMLGGELFKGFTIVGNGFWTQETSGDKNGTWGFTVAGGFELVERVLRVGGEMRMSWLYRLGKDEPFRTYELKAGPSFNFRPLELLKKGWGRHLKLEGTCFFGCNDRSPMVEGVGLIGYEF